MTDLGNRDLEVIASARERARIRREIRKSDDRIANQLDALCDEVERLRAEVATAWDTIEALKAQRLLYKEDRDRLRALLSRVQDHIDSDEGPAAIQLRKDINAAMGHAK